MWPAEILLSIPGIVLGSENGYNAELQKSRHHPFQSDACCYFEHCLCCLVYILAYIGVNT